MTDKKRECQGIVAGDYRAPNGANRHSECTFPARFIAERGEWSREYCGQHIRRYRKMNRLHPGWYRIQEIAATS